MPASNGHGVAHAVAIAGPRWEVYGHWREGTVPRTDVYYLVAG